MVINTSNTNTTVRSIVTVGWGAILSQLLNFLTLPVITRLYSPSEYAVWALIFNIMAIFGALAPLRYEISIVLANDEKSAANLFILCLSLSFLFMFVWFFIVVFFENMVLWLVGVEKKGAWIYFIPLLVGVTGIYQTSLSWFTRKKYFRLFSVLTVLFVFITSVIQIFLGFCGYNDMKGLLAGSIIGQSVVALIALFYIFLKERSILFESFKVQHIFALLKIYKNCPLFMVPYTLAGTLRDRGLIYFLNQFVSKTFVGHFSFAQRITQIPSSLVATAIRPVLFQKATTSPFSEFENTYKVLMNFLITLGMPLMVYSLTEFPNIFEIVFGKTWREAGLYASILSLPAFFLLLVTWSDRLFDIKSKQKLELQFELLFSTLAIGGIVIGFVLSFQFQIVIMLLSFILSCYYLVLFFAVFKIWQFSKELLVTFFFRALVMGISALVAFYVPLTILPGFWATLINTLIIILFLILYGMKFFSLNL